MIYLNEVNSSNIGKVGLFCKLCQKKGHTIETCYFKTSKSKGAKKFLKKFEGNLIEASDEDEISEDVVGANFNALDLEYAF